MKKKLLYLFLFSFATISSILYSCHKDAAINQQEGIIPPMDLATAKKYYVALKRTQGDFVTETSTASSSVGKPNRKFPLFNMAYVSENRLFSFVESPLRYNRRPSLLVKIQDGSISNLDDDKSQLASTFDRLIIYKNKQTGQINQRIVTFIPSTTYLAAHQNDASGNHINKLDKDFSGYLCYKDWSGKPLFMIKIINGKPAGIHTFSIKKNIKSANQASTEHCVEVITTYWEQDCWEDYPEVGMEVCGEWYITGQDVDYQCTDDGSGDGNPDCFETGTCPDDGGGCSSCGPDTSTTQKPDPCATAKAVAASTTYNGKVADVSSYITKGIEHGWIFTQDPGGAYSPKSVNADPAAPGDIDFSISTDVINMIHNHYNGTGINTTFDGSDISAISLAYNGGHITKLSSFTSTVITASGTYMIAVNDPALFAAFATQWNTATSIDFTLQHAFNYDPSHSGTINETGLVRFLQQNNSGLTLLKKDANGNFNTLTYTNSELTITNCN